MSLDQTMKFFTELTAKVSSKEKRLTDLLRDPTKEPTNGWHMYVPHCFNDALDIKLTERVKEKVKNCVWTQGSMFSFSTGDILYDTPAAYGSWNLENIKRCVQIKAAVPCTISETGSRFSGSVTISLYEPVGNKLEERQQITLSQDMFVMFLISGALP